MKKKIKLARGQAWSAVEIQRTYLEQAEDHFAQSPDPVTKDILQRWRSVLTKLEEDPMQLSREIDWVIKKNLIESYIQRKGCDWTDSRVQMMDLQYHNVVQSKGLYYSLERGNHVERLISTETLAHAEEFPPEETRAYFRGTCLKKFSKDIYAASWTSLLLDLGNGSIKKIPLLDPLKGSRDLVGPILDKAESVEDLLNMIST